MGTQKGGVRTMSESYINNKIWNGDGARLAFSQSRTYPVRLRMKLWSKPWSRPSGSTHTLKIKSLVEDECAQNLCLYRSCRRSGAQDSNY